MEDDPLIGCAHDDPDKCVHVFVVQFFHLKNAANNQYCFSKQTTGSPYRSYVLYVLFREDRLFDPAPGDHRVAVHGKQRVGMFYGGRFGHASHSFQGTVGSDQGIPVQKARSVVVSSKDIVDGPCKQRESSPLILQLQVHRFRLDKLNVGWIDAPRVERQGLPF